MKTLALIPHYKHETMVAQVVAGVRAFGLDVLIVDDGSGEPSGAVLRDLAEQEGVFVLFRPVNGGKGAAMKAGLKWAVQQGYSHVLQVDADGQHELNDISKMLLLAQENPEAVVCGAPQYGDDAPKARVYGRKITDFWNALHTGSRDIRDGMCGFRLYPAVCTFAVICEENIGNRMDFDTEILIHLYWRRVPLVWLDTPVRYAADGISHFRSWQDNVLISKMHARLFCQMLARRWRNKGRVR
ncbi:MAG: glycosyltransferase family 2 protein [Neisseria sp.]|nr:glycosyltransferase family 2 protein [Neisseria sp.]